MKQFARCLLIVALAAACLPAQETPFLTLNQTLALGTRQNLELLAARRRRAEAIAGIRTARERVNPVFSFSGSRDAPHQSLLLAQPIELGGKRASRIAVAEAETAVTDVEIQTLERQVRRNLREAYYTLASSIASAERTATVAQLAERLLGIAQERFKAGDVPHLEVIQAELEVARARADHEVALQEVKVAQSKLNVLLNEPSGKEWKLAGTLNDRLPSFTLADLTDRALASNADILRLTQELKLAQAKLAQARSERIPNFELQAGMDLNNPPDYTVGGRAGFAITLPILNRNRGAIELQLAQEERLGAEMHATRRAVTGEVESAFLELNAQRTQVDLYRDRLIPAARQLESLAEESYKAGRSGILVVLGAQQNVQEVEKGYLDALFALQKSFAALEQTVGVPLVIP